MKIAKFAVAAGLTAIALGFGISNAGAWPIGPSARAAARLKYNPPKNWVEHYLGDDRYKVAGGIWKVVSTDLDSYYHRPDCPHMLRQDAGMVIGFASAKDAQEAGYTADGRCSPDAAEVMFAGGPVGGQSGGTFVLSDKASSLKFPAGWTRRQTQFFDMKGMRVGVDVFNSPNSGQVLAITMNMPAGKVDFSQFVSYEGFKRMQASRRQTGGSILDNTGIVNNQLSSMFGRSDTILNRSIPSPLRVAGLNGVTLKTPTGVNMPKGQRALHMIPRGSKLFVIGDMTKDGKGVGAIVKSLNPQ